MDMQDYLRFVLALAFVLALMGGLALLMRRLGLGGAKLPGMGPRRLEVLETRMIDHRHKLAVIRCDDRQHLLLLGPDGARTIDTNLPAPAKDPAP